MYRTCLAPIVALAALLSTGTAVSGPWDGQYYPHGSEPAHFCKFGDFGAWSIRNDRLSVEEGSCLLTNPVTVRDMPGLLYDAECWVEGDRWVDRVLVVRRHDGIEWVSPTHTWHLVACP